MEIFVRNATIRDVEIIAALVHQLLVELTPEDKSPPAFEKIYATAKTLLEDIHSIWCFLAMSEDGEAIGVLTLNECAAIYAGGRFGEISELYVKPNYRSKGVAPKLLVAAKEFGRLKAWKSMEVGAPSLPKWERTVAFYRENGFYEIGPRLVISCEDSSTD